MGLALVKPVAKAFAVPSASVPIVPRLSGYEAVSTTGDSPTKAIKRSFPERHHERQLVSAVFGEHSIPTRDTRKTVFVVLMAVVALVLFAAGIQAAQVAIARAGGIPPLVALARGGSEKQKHEAAAALWKLAENADNQVAIAKAGGAPACAFTLSSMSATINAGEVGCEARAWRIAPGKSLDRIEFNTSQSYFEGTDTLDFFAVESDGQLRWLTQHSRPFRASNPIPPELWLTKATDKVMLVLDAPSGGSSFIMHYSCTAVSGFHRRRIY